MRGNGSPTPITCPVKGYINAYADVSDHLWSYIYGLMMMIMSMTKLQFPGEITPNSPHNTHTQVKMDQIQNDFYLWTMEWMVFNLKIITSRLTQHRHGQIYILLARTLWSNMNKIENVYYATINLIISALLQCGQLLKMNWLIEGMSITMMINLFLKL